MRRLDIRIATGASVLAIGAILLPFSVAGVLQPIADSPNHLTAVIAWCGLCFAGSCLLFAVLVSWFDEPALGWLIVVSAIGAATCAGPVVAVAMAAAVLAAVSIALRPDRPSATMAPDAGPGHVRHSSSARPRRLFA